MNKYEKISDKNESILNRSYRSVFLVQNRDWWHSCPFTIDKNQDLVLSFDFGLVHLIAAEGGAACYIDHLLDTETMEKYNHEMYDFFAKWHFDKDGNDIFAYKGIKVGNAFRIEIWNDITYYSRLFISLIEIKKIKCHDFYIGFEDKNILNFVSRLDLKVKTWKYSGLKKKTEYYFPIFQWNSNALYGSGFKTPLRSYVIPVIKRLIKVFFRFLKRQKPPLSTIYVQSYYPTRRIKEELKNNKNITVLSDSVSYKDQNKVDVFPSWRSTLRHKELANNILEQFERKRCVHWDVDGINISDSLYTLIISRISKAIPSYLCFIDSLLKYFAKRKLLLAVPITNLASKNCLLLNYCESKNIPTYLIINGLLTSAFSDEAKYATWINSYGESLRDNYFKGMNNIVCLGDPRIDDYINNGTNHEINHNCPTITIGASGYNNCDLNGYVAVEFDFLNDIMLALKKLIANGRKMKIIVKVRANGYLSQYSNFLAEYYPDIQVELHDKIAFRDVLSKCDLYISIYSETLFEASCLGIPVLYYKKDTEINYPPFDGKSELVTAKSQGELIEKLISFYNNETIYNAFRERKIMEKYIGPLDGKNLERNMQFIYSLMGQN